MTGTAGDGTGASGRLATLLTGAASDAARAAGGRTAGVFLRSRTPGLLRLAALSGLPGELFRPWWRLHTDRPFPVTDAHRLGVAVLLPNPAESMRRYPQFAAGLPFPFGSLSVPVATDTEPYGVVTVLRPSVPDLAGLVAPRERLAQVADGLAAALHELEDDGIAARWDDPPTCVHPPPAGPSRTQPGSITWEPGADRLTLDPRARALLGLDADGTLSTLLSAVAAEDARRLAALLREASHGRPPPLPVPVHTTDGMLRLLHLWTAQDEVPFGPAPHRVGGAVLEPGPALPADAAADLLPEGVFCLDRLGVVVYANTRAALLLDVARDRLLGRPLWEAVPWLVRPGHEDHLRGAMLSPETVRFHAQRPSPDGAGPHRADGDWLALSIHPGPDLLACTVVPAASMADTPTLTDAEEAAPAWQPDGAAPAAPEAQPTDSHFVPPPESASVTLAYRPIVLAIALTEAVTARQVSAVVVQELLPAFGGRRLAIYLLQERHLYLAWETGFPPGFLTPFEGVALDARLPGVETLTSGRPLFFDSMEQLAAAYPGIPLDAKEGARAFLPLIASGRPVGSCILGFERRRSFSTEERTVLTALAGLIAHAMEKAQRYDTEAALARGLQGALLPRRLSTHPEVETAGRYLPGTEGMDVGGDWYDVVEAGDGLALVIGDVQGHGVQAAATMGQLRSAVRAFALSDRPPEEVVAGTNHLLTDLDPGQFASCCYVRLDPATGRARMVRAGHPPPLLRHADGRTDVLDLPGGMVLGVDPNAQYPVTELDIEAGAVLALYTDGLVERAGTDIDEGITTLRQALSASPEGTRTLSQMADRLTATARRAADRPDDIALLLASRRTP
ncbi:SpoIIE family protein phosphatase [Streptomyces sp. NPDC057386]|uniref:SpoIIE family protein phosphatase n=1 Tax=unclassified Streptomyces TaxID=2593676 RepID=UPI0036288B25